MERKTNYSKMSTETNVEESIEQVAPVIEDAPEPEETIGTVVDCIRLNIRKEPDRNATIVGEIERGDSVVILDEIGDFYKIDDDQYCMKKFIEIVK